jgi:hypothetical protein
VVARWSTDGNQVLSVRVGGEPRTGGYDELIAALDDALVT